MIMNKILAFLLCATISVSYVSSNYRGSTLGPVVLSGAVVKNIGTVIVKKYPRKKCPVCKGTGKYLSGDGITLTDCGYCEPEKSETPKQQTAPKKCSNKHCKCKHCDCDKCGCLPSIK